MDPLNFTSLIEQANKLERNFLTRSSNITKRSTIWEKYENVQINHPCFIQSKSNTHIIKLNVGGYFYSTTEATLQSVKDTFFTSTVLTSDLSVEYFIDRPGKNFGYILNYLRELNRPTTYLENLDANKKSEVALEAEFYGVIKFI